MIIPRHTVFFNFVLNVFFTKPEQSNSGGFEVWFILTFEVEVQKNTGIADPFANFPSESFKGPHFAH
jgi:hypothetical protein